MKSRTKNLKKHIKVSLLYKIFAMFLSFYAVRLSLDYLGIQNFGLWAVILSVLNWIVFFDFGIANGVKNRVAECWASNDQKGIKSYISTGYITLLIFVVTAYSFLYNIIPFINWQLIFGHHYLDNEFLIKLVRIAVFFVLFNFWITIINQIANAFQQSSLVVLSQFVGLVVSVLLLTLITKISDSNIIYVAVVYGVSISSGNLFVTYVFFKKQVSLIPSVKFFSKNKARKIFSLGWTFFILQLIVLVILTADKIIIVNLLGPSDVSHYEVVYRYFSLLLVFHSIINSPLWPAYTESYKNKDFKWILNTISNLDRLMICYVLIAVIMSLAGNWVFSYWLSNDDISLELSNYLFFGGMIVMYIMYTTLAHLTNGIERTNIQLYTGLIGAIINIPLSIYFVSYFNMGINGVVLATAFSFSIFVLSGRFYIVRELKKEYLEQNRNAEKF